MDRGPGAEMSIEAHDMVDIPPNVMVDKTYGCWIWAGSKGPDGYGRTSQGALAHVAIWEQECGPIELIHNLDHICRRRDCVNPAHLEPVTQSENLKRRAWRYRRKRKKCPVGHDLAYVGRLTPEGGRICRVCSRVI